MHFQGGGYPIYSKWLRALFAREFMGVLPPWKTAFFPIKPYLKWPFFSDISSEDFPVENRQKLSTFLAEKSEDLWENRQKIVSPIGARKFRAGRALFLPCLP